MPDSPSPSPPLLRVRRMTLKVAGRTLVEELDLELAAAERLVVVGPNGSGKSTLLAALAGLITPQAGSVERPGRPPGMLFQDGALWPHLDVDAHLAFVDTADDRAWRERLLETFELTALRGHRPAQMSGGERLRLGLARAFAHRPSWVLLDEPLASLDPGAVQLVRDRLPPLLDELGAACITVTHDPDDLLLFGERLLALEGDGRWWLGPARFAAQSPPTASLAAFSDRGTLLQARADDGGRVDFGLGFVVEGWVPGARCRAFLDAEAIHFSVDGSEGLPARFVCTDRRGSCWVRVEERLLRCAGHRGPLQAGDAVRVVLRGEPRVLTGS